MMDCFSLLVAEPTVDQGNFRYHAFYSYFISLYLV